jgi:hypothetical protein
VYQLELISYKNLLFRVKRKFRDSELKPNFDTNVMKEWTRTDTLLRKDGILYCCETIPDAEIIQQ